MTSNATFKKSENDPEWQFFKYPDNKKRFENYKTNLASTNSYRGYIRFKFINFKLLVILNS